jgi:hypothetical protein
MAIIKNVELHFAKLNPKRPNATFNKENPTWELQLRTSSLEQKKEWDNLSLKPKLIVYKEGEENEGEPILTESGKKQWRVNLRKRSKDKDGNPAAAVKVVNGSLEEIDPDTIGNGSIAHVRIYQYEYDSAGEKKVATVLMALQLVKHIVYEAAPRDDEFEMTETQTFNPKASEETEDEDETPKSTKAPKAPKVTPEVESDEDIF